MDSHFRPYLLQGRTSEAKNDCNKKSPPLDKTTSKQPVLTSRDAARPDVRLRTRFGTPASPSIEHRSTAAAAPRLGRSSKLTPLACSECIAATADGRSSRRVVRRTSCPRCRRAAAQLWAYRGLRLACCGCDVSPPAVAAHTISAAARRRSVGSDGGLHLWNDVEWPMAATTSAAASAA